ncbi:SLAC1 family transporter, partial [Thermococcus sp.]
TKSITPAWFIPPVGLIVIPISGAKLMSLSSGTAKEMMAFINYFSWGSGFFLYLALFAVVMYRFIRHEPMPCGIAPSIWMNLGSIGASITALFALVNNSSIAVSKDPFFIFAFFLWGLGFWWFVMALALTLHYVRKLNLPYSASWWAFIFPLGAFINATLDLGNVFGLEIMKLFGYLILWPLLLLWVVTLLKALRP